MNIIVTPPIKLGKTYAAIIPLACGSEEPKGGVRELRVEVELGPELTVELGVTLRVVLRLKSSILLTSDVHREPRMMIHTRQSCRRSSSQPVTNQCSALNCQTIELPTKSTSHNRRCSAPQPNTLCDSCKPRVSLALAVVCEAES